MTLKTVTSSSGKSFKLGRIAPRRIQPKLCATKLVDLTSILVPDDTSYRDAASASERDVYMNDQLGDCVPAGLNHLAGLASANAGGSFVPTASEVLADYMAIGGYVMGNPSTDNGCDEDTAMNYYQTHGWANGTKAVGAIAVDATNWDEVRAMVYLFENVVFGVGLPDEWISPFPSTDGFVWDAAPTVPENGHCFVAIDLKGGRNGVLVVNSWGLYGGITQAACAQCAVHKVGGQMFCVLTPDIVNRAIAKAPNGMDWATLVGYFDKMGGHVSTIALP